MVFSSLDTDAGLTTLNTFLADRSYIEGYTASQADVAVFEAVKKAPLANKYEYASRWYSHIASFSAGQRTAWPGVKKDLSQYGPATAAKTAAAEEDDIDLFGSDDEEEDAEAEKIKQQRLAEYAAKKANKPVVIAKSSILIDVKPWDDETDMAALEAAVREIQLDGLLWGASKLIPIGYGIKKLQISCVVEDDKVGVDDLEERITAIEDHVQSMDVAAFNKI